MRMRNGWGVAAALLLAWGAPHARATDEEGNSGKRPVARQIDRPGLIDKLIDLATPDADKNRDAKPEKKGAAKPNEKAASNTRKAAGPPVISEQARHEAALLRRLEVCDKLREIALETNNKELDQLADELDARARAVYAQRTARLQQKSPDTELDEQILDQKLGIEPMNPEQMPVGKPTAARTGKGGQYQAATREENR